MLACVPSKTIVEQRGRQVKPGRRDEGETTNKSWRSPNIDNIDINNIELNHQLLTTFSFKGFILLKWLLLLFCYNIPLMLHISIEKLQNPFSQFQGAVVPNNQLKISLLVRISSTRRPLATREITSPPLVTMCTDPDHQVRWQSVWLTIKRSSVNIQDLQVSYSIHIKHSYLTPILL